MTQNQNDKYELPISRTAFVGFCFFGLALFCFLIAVWTGSDKIGETGAVFMVPAFVCGMTELLRHC